MLPEMAVLRLLDVSEDADDWLLSVDVLALLGEDGLLGELTLTVDWLLRVEELRELLVSVDSDEVLTLDALDPLLSVESVELGDDGLDCELALTELPLLGVECEDLLLLEKLDWPLSDSVDAELPELTSATNGTATSGIATSGRATSGIADRCTSHVTIGSLLLPGRHRLHRIRQ